jgi:hypothetical protein
MIKKIVIIKSMILICLICILPMVNAEKQNFIEKTEHTYNEIFNDEMINSYSRLLDSKTTDSSILGIIIVFMLMMLRYIFGINFP